MGIGWAKPTPVNPSNLEGGRYGDAIVAMAGPLSNLVLAVVAALPFRYIVDTGLGVPTEVLSVLLNFIYMNVALCLFNLLPIVPLDGSHVLFALMSPSTAWRYRPVLTQYGPIMLLVAAFLPTSPVINHLRLRVRPDRHSDRRVPGRGLRCIASTGGRPRSARHARTCGRGYVDLNGRTSRPG